MKHTISLTLALSIFWILNSGYYSSSLLIIMLGILSIALVLFIAHRMDVIDHESHIVHLSFKIPGYFLWLIKEIVLSNIEVVKCIWLGNSSISPTLATIKTNQNTDLGKVIFANSITITPGTVTVDLVEDRLIVHALQRKTIEVLSDGEMDRRILELDIEC
jgi:multicomponent Na+:H+ antiporter subunit E